jgi:hypothetical protein
MGDRTSPTQGTVDAVPTVPGQGGCDHAGQDERDPISCLAQMMPSAGRTRSAATPAATRANPVRSQAR